MAKERRRPQPNPFEHVLSELKKRAKIRDRDTGLKAREYANAMKYLYQTQNSDGAKELLVVLTEYELSLGLPETPVQTAQRVRENLDNMANLADLAENDPNPSSLEVALYFLQIRSGRRPLGPVAQFYRNAVGYNPQRPLLN
jgi:hypothetical protein